MEMSITHPKNTNIIIPNIIYFIKYSNHNFQNFQIHYLNYIEIYRKFIENLLAILKAKEL